MNRMKIKYVIQAQLNSKIRFDKHRHPAPRKFNSNFAFQALQAYLEEDKRVYVHGLNMAFDWNSALYGESYWSERARNMSEFDVYDYLLIQYWINQ